MYLAESGWIKYTVKKGLLFSRPQPGCHLPNSPRTGIIKLFPAREGLVSDIPAGDGKTANLFLQCRSLFKGVAQRFLPNSASPPPPFCESPVKFPSAALYSCWHLAIRNLIDNRGI